MSNRQDAVFEELIIRSATMTSATAPSTAPSMRPGRRWKNTGRGGKERRKREAQQRHFGRGARHRRRGMAGAGAQAAAEDAARLS